MRILVTGASGLLGRAVFAELHRNRRFETVGVAYSRARGNLSRVNLLCKQEIDSFIEKTRPDCIIHCAAIRNPDVCEENPELTIRLNVDSTKWLADAAFRLRSWMIYVSSDYVFDGSNPPYFPNSQTNPMNAYGRSKLEGEVVLKKMLDDYCVLRLPLLYGDVEFLEESAVTIIAKKLLTGQQQEIDNWSTRYPTHTNDVALVLRQMIEHRMQNVLLDPVCHWSTDKPYTKYEMARLMCDIMHIPRCRAQKENHPKPGAVRPKNTHLDSSYLQSLGVGRHTAFEKGIADSIKPFL